jgi:hypothetical protein
MCGEITRVMHRTHNLKLVNCEIQKQRHDFKDQRNDSLVKIHDIPKVHTSTDTTIIQDRQWPPSAGVTTLPHVTLKLFGMNEIQVGSLPSGELFFKIL